MCKTAEAKRFNALMKERSDKYYKANKEQCAKHNFYKRCEVFIKYGKQVWPPIKRHELEDFISATKLPGKYWRNKKLW